MITLYDSAISGNCYKIRLLLTQLAKKFKRIEMDIFKGGTRTTEFLSKNVNGKVPAVELEDGNILAESNAIIWYFAENTPFLPEGKLNRARILQWMFFEQYSHEPYVAVARFVKHLQPDSPRLAELPNLHKKGYAALDVMEKHLSTNDFFVANCYTISDIALYAYTHVAHEGGFDFTSYPAIRAWFDRIKNQPNHILITQ
ncbi:MAG: glutathione S-transferase family protein [Alphaproteobacteria bacterium]|nr:glutathione S-transferase family protein [Alphaproteobacteria bacterium]